MWIVREIPHLQIIFGNWEKTLFCITVAKMLRKPTIRALGSILLLLTFTFSITPRIFLHDLFAHHKDLHSIIGSRTEQLSRAGYHCDCESQVVVMPYLDCSQRIPQEFATSFISPPVGSEDQTYPAGHFIFGFRGPPAGTSLS
jgi:hypothetical protein